MKKIIHIIPNLNAGGAEATLVKLVNKDINNLHYIITFTEGDDFAKRITNQKCRFKKIIINNFNFITNLLLVRKEIINYKPNYIHCWMTYASLIGFIVSIFFKTKIIWSIRTALPKTMSELFYIRKKIEIFTYLLLNIILKFKKNIRLLYVSQSALESFKLLGIYNNNYKVITNGTDYKNINISDLKNEINIRPITIGYIGNNEKKKNYKFVEDLILLFNKKNSKVKFKIVGNINPIKTNLKNVEYLGVIDDLTSFYKSLHIFILPSLSEGFSNSLIEAMSYGKYCIVSNTGDSSHILNSNGKVIQNNIYYYEKFIQEYINKSNCEKLTIAKKCIQTVTERNSNDTFYELMLNEYKN